MVFLIQLERKQAKFSVYLVALMAAVPNAQSIDNWFMFGSASCIHL